MTLGNPGPMPRSHPQVSESPGVPGSPWEPNPTDPRFLKPGRSRPLTTRCGQEAPKGISNGAEVPSHTGPAGRLAAHHPLPVLLSQARACTFSTSACVVVINSWHVRTETSQKPQASQGHRTVARTGVGAQVEPGVSHRDKEAQRASGTQTTPTWQTSWIAFCESVAGRGYCGHLMSQHTGACSLSLINI